MSIRRTKYGTWESRTKLPDGREHSRTFKTRGEATAHQAATRTDQTRGTWRDPDLGTIPLNEYAEQWLARRHKISNNTRRRLQATITNQLNPTLGDRTIGSIRTTDVEELVERLDAEDLAPRTIKKAILALSAMLEKAAREGRCQPNICRHVELPRPAADEQLWLTPAEVERLAGVLGDYYGLMVLMDAYTGLRQGELWALTAADVDLLRGQVRVERSVNGAREVGPTKTHRTRVVPLVPWLVEALTPLVEERAARGDVWTSVNGVRLRGLLWTNSQAAPLRQGNFRRDKWLPALRKAGLDPAVRMHDLRHSAPTWMIGAGVDVVTVSRWLGHKDVTTTLNVYSHLFSGNMEAAVNVLSAMRGRDEVGPASVGQVVSL